MDASNTLSIVAICVSVVSLLVSAGLLFVHRVNQMERRHGEITKLRNDYLQMLANADQRLVSIVTNSEIIRLEVRRQPDSDTKFQLVELLPGAIAAAQKQSSSVRGLRQSIEELDTRKWNTSRVLLALHTFENKIRDLNKTIEDVEQSVVESLKTLRSASG